MIDGNLFPVKRTLGHPASQDIIIGIPVPGRGKYLLGKSHRGIDILKIEIVFTFPAVSVYSLPILIDLCPQCLIFLHQPDTAPEAPRLHHRKQNHHCPDNAFSAPDKRTPLQQHRRK